MASSLLLDLIMLSVINEQRFILLPLIYNVDQHSPTAQAAARQHVFVELGIAQPINLGQ